eukprot:3524690-Rhodomonas_salina.2
MPPGPGPAGRHPIGGTCCTVTVPVARWCRTCHVGATGSVRPVGMMLEASESRDRLGFKLQWQCCFGFKLTRT